jgi:UDP-N-acetylglucosamine 1-carboxyvinyltransferase
VVKTMRASIYVLAPLVARFGRAACRCRAAAPGAAPVNIHLAGLAALGAKVEIEHGYIVAAAERLRGAAFRLDIASVGATANLMMAPRWPRARRCSNAAREPSSRPSPTS